MKMEVDSDELKGFILEVIRQNLIIHSHFSTSGLNQDVSLSILDDSEPFSETTVFSTEE